jgi:hypothetical protein
MDEGTRGLGHGYETREVKGHGWLGTFREEVSSNFWTLRGPKNPNQLKCLTFVPVILTPAQPMFP